MALSRGYLHEYLSRHIACARRRVVDCSVDLKAKAGGYDRTVALRDRPNQERLRGMACVLTGQVGGHSNSGRGSGGGSGQRGSLHQRGGPACHRGGAGHGVRRAHGDVGVPGGRWDNGCSDNIGWAFSADAGHSWQHGYLPGLTGFSRPPGPFVRASDPSVAYNAALGEWIAASLACNNTSPNPNVFVPSPAVEVNISADGVHWSKTISVTRIKKGQDFDKPWITCDNSTASRFYGNCYMEWDVDNQTTWC